MAQRAPFVSLWSRDDVRTAVVDFLPTKTIAVLPVVAKPLRALQTSLLVTAIRRRGKTTVPTPQTTRALLDALLVGETQYFCEKWERGLEQWSEESSNEYTVYRDGPVLVLTRHSVRDHGTRGNHNQGMIHQFRGENLLVTRLRVTMSYTGGCPSSGAVGYAQLHGPGFDNPYLHDFMDSPSFHRAWTGEGEQVLLCWSYLVLVTNVTSGSWYTVDARIRHDSQSMTSGIGLVDVSVNGQLELQGQEFRLRPLSLLDLHHFSQGISEFAELEVWYEKAAPNQAWAAEQSSESESDSDA